ncbi:oxidoreductase [Nostoc linckia z18]|uniref:Oxidoreductase n=2 Tax=Nostoc linckia TaxID=92942 RepID=A0A9Q6EMM1_NOSLI|nr:Gfo/Idh/MocA family oxidoreductase [Nostoc linckia]PHK41948.1 oxidoreductase [Nostoc linckia z15]PHK46679.1 oxidoreductase [Nostoc linckia z16]PHJ67520.1 oxidoreductase [Nostoc linckia z1]PHJ72545.1 oxidoreductase [Nostoc linckia z3]PHJ74887.1 oxidoreductase [Nostoc linckia z2]
MTNQIKIAVIGVGRWGVHLLRNFLAHPSVSVIAVVDPHPERLTGVKQQFNLNEDVILTTQWQDLKQVPGLTAVAIATPASTHYALIQDALQQGYHVLAEKPLTLDPAECRELCQLAEQHNLILMVDHTYLFHPAVERGQTVVQAGKLGDLRYGYATRTHLGPVRQDVDALWDLAIHDIAIFNTWLGQSPVKVQAKGMVWLQGAVGEDADSGRSGDTEKLLCASPFEFGSLDSTETAFPAERFANAQRLVENTPTSSPRPRVSVSPSQAGAVTSLGVSVSPSQGLADLVWITLTYPDNFQAYIHLCWLNPDKQRRLGIVGSRGSLIFDELSLSSPLTLLHGEFEQQGNQFIPVNQSQVMLELEPGEPLQRVCDRFVVSILNNTPSEISSGWVGTQLVEILAALTVSLKEDGKVVFLNQ